MNEILQNKEALIGKSKLVINDKVIEFPEPILNIEVFEEHVVPKIVVLFLSDVNTSKLKNNIHCYNMNGDCVWTIKDLILEYVSRNSQLTRSGDWKFFAMKKLDCHLFYTVDISCYYYVHVGRNMIIYREGHW